jgi:hypothetical protein
VRNNKILELLREFQVFVAKVMGRVKLLPLPKIRLYCPSI